MLKIIGTTFSVFLVVLAFSIAACGVEEEATQETTALAGGCTAVIGAATICTEYHDIYKSFVSTVESQCTSAGSTWSSDGCSSTEAVGYCNITGVGGQPDDATMRMYLYTAGSGQDSCDSFGGGTWVTL